MPRQWIVTTDLAVDAKNALDAARKAAEILRKDPPRIFDVEGTYINLDELQGTTKE